MVPLILAALCFVVGYGLTVWGRHQWRQLESQLPWQAPLPPLVAQTLLLRGLWPSTRWIAVGLRRLPWQGLRRRLQTPLDILTDTSVTVDEWLSLSLCCAAGCAGLAALGLPGAPSAAALVGAGMGAVFPSLTVWVQQRQRRHEIRRTVPLAFELLALTLAAGCELSLAIPRVAEILPAGPLRDVWQRLQRDLALGVEQITAWRNLAARARVPALDAVVALLVQAVQFGAPISELLQAHVETLSQERFARAERAGARASQFILLPLLTCVVPAYFLFIFGGAIAVFCTQGLDGLMHLVVAS